MSDYDKMCQFENIKRAYRWIQSNPDAKYKSYFRDAYTSYATASEINLKNLLSDLRRRAYEPQHASKIYSPKPSGVLRPLTLLTVNDQIVYQACVNIIAEKLCGLVKKKYFEIIFGHLYAGKKSRFFYLKWQDSYRLFTKKTIDNIDEGYNWVANFDLAAFYDSIDHHVLKHFLLELKINDDLISFLLKCLKIWTASTWTNYMNIIYIEHGIPQGPLSSGMLSEAILRYLDEKGTKSKSVRYLRYVDDIKIFAKEETPLRQRIITLDLACKDIGLFPQSTKINIRKVKDPKEEIKSVSIPPEPSIRPFVKQNELRKRLLELMRNATIAQGNLTRFKYLLSKAKRGSIKRCGNRSKAVYPSGSTKNRA